MIVFLSALETTEIVNIAIILNNVFYLQIILSCFFFFFFLVPIMQVNFLLNYPFLKPWCRFLTLWSIFKQIFVYAFGGKTNKEIWKKVLTSTVLCANMLLIDRHNAKQLLFLELWCCIHSRGVTEDGSCYSHCFALISQFTFPQKPSQVSHFLFLLTWWKGCCKNSGTVSGT